MDPNAAAELFMAEKIRRESDISIAAGSKSRAQVYFEARHSICPDAEDEDNKNDDKEDEKSNKFFEFQIFQNLNSNSNVVIIKNT